MQFRIQEFCAIAKLKFSCGETETDTIGYTDCFIRIPYGRWFQNPGKQMIFSKYLEIFYMNQLLSMQKINLNITLNFPETAPCQTSVAMIMGGNPTKFDLILKLQLSLRFLDFLGFPKQLPTPGKPYSSQRQVLLQSTWFFRIPCLFVFMERKLLSCTCRQGYHRLPNHFPYERVGSPHPLTLSPCSARILVVKPWQLVLPCHLEKMEGFFGCP